MLEHQDRDRRLLPSVHSLLHNEQIGAKAGRMPRAFLKNLIQQTVEACRTGGTTEPTQVVEAVLQQLQKLEQPHYQRVINATGVLLHTNLGRAPLPVAAMAQAAHIATGYSNLEYDVDSAKRGQRDQRVRWLLTLMSGAQQALVVNNNAAALHLILHTLASGCQAVISRGELIEIGDGFRIPDIITASGAKLREVGSTNRTRLQDYEQAIDTNTALLLKVHPSNFRIVGFTRQPTLPELLQLARRRHLPLLYDLGSADLSACSHAATSNADLRPATMLASGVDIVCFSADKLLGGPQAGIILGKNALLQRLRTNPLFRALRLDKVTLSLLEWVLQQKLRGEAGQPLPITEMLQRPTSELRQMGKELIHGLEAALMKWECQVSLVEGSSSMGGGSRPGCSLPTLLVQVSSTRQRLDQLDRHLRQQPQPIISRRDGGLIFDLRSLLDRSELQAIVRACRQWQPGG